ncbi:hypothetical protein AZE42_13805 [Rhizopogon vesiculosus]|uniref:Uncharacterized protein n=1 Tax=Rhizopogon vesiculosus TaxID=180088 RepID=A0A1J8QLN4_9AGAM|nr:hypothetical protein AZE42_13805 [Rhizopogon vesiculosus]
MPSCTWSCTLLHLVALSYTSSHSPAPHSTPSYTLVALSHTIVTPSLTIVALSHTFSYW